MFTLAKTLLLCDKNALTCSISSKNYDLRNYAIVQRLTSYAWTSQRIIGFLLGGIMRLDCARGKKQVWRPCVRTWGLPEANVLHWSSFDIVTTFRPRHSELAPGQSCPLAPFVTPLVTARGDAPQQIMVHSSNQRHTGTLGFRRGKIFNTPEVLRHFEETRIGEFCRAMVLFQKLAQKYREVFPEFFKSCPNLRTPIALTQTLWQNTSIYSWVDWIIGFMWS